LRTLLWQSSAMQLPATAALTPATQARRVADWFAQLNQKMGGDLKKIRVVGEYMIEVWKAVGMDLSKVDFLWASDEINARPAEYWTLVMDIAMKFNLARVQRCTQIMGRAEGDELQASQIFYPCMQCADIFFLKARALPLLSCWKLCGAIRLCAMSE
jgi:tyrosyl-tRNA synthetase